MRYLSNLSGYLALLGQAAAETLGASVPSTIIVAVAMSSPIFRTLDFFTKSIAFQSRKRLFNLIKPLPLRSFLPQPVKGPIPLGYDPFMVSDSISFPTADNDVGCSGFLASIFKA
ncbi:hypothetical protein V6N13_131922 [Hibiscus sabdariffa]|uniref:Uncharacterized protein n=1 Tax=Hibiscus sabdariffa TaxID=183260 RepID=A0ABR2NIU5_9ROSI